MSTVKNVIRQNQLVIKFRDNIYKMILITFEDKLSQLTNLKHDNRGKYQKTKYIASLMSSDKTNLSRDVITSKNKINHRQILSKKKIVTKVKICQKQT